MQRAAAAIIVFRVDISAGSDEERANAKARSRRRLAQADRTLKRKCGLQPLNVQNETGLQRLLSKAQAGSGRCTNCCACNKGSVCYQVMAHKRIARSTIRILQSWRLQRSTLAEHVTWHNVTSHRRFRVSSCKILIIPKP